MTIGNRMQEIRKSRNLTQKQLAEQLGLATGTVQQYELGKRTPNATMLKKIADALGVDVSSLYIKVRIGWGDEPLHDVPLQPMEEYRAERVTQEVLSLFELLNLQGKIKVKDYISDLCDIPQYRYGRDDG